MGRRRWPLRVLLALCIVALLFGLWNLRFTRPPRVNEVSIDAAGQRYANLKDLQCDAGLAFVDAMSADNEVPLNRRTLVPMPSDTPPADATTTATRSSAIPRVIVQASCRDTVPEAMRAAMDGIIAAHPHYRHVYFSDARTEEFVRDEFGGRTAAEAFPDIGYLRPNRRYQRRSEWQKVVDALMPAGPQPPVARLFAGIAARKTRAEFFAALYLWKHGGVWLHHGFESGQKTLDDVLVPAVDFVGAARPGDRASPDFVAAAPGHPVVYAWLKSIVRHVHEEYYGPNPDSVTGVEVLSEAFAAHANRGTKDRLLALHHAPQCLQGEIVAEGGGALFTTRYAKYGQDASWYRLRGDDYTTGWMKRQVYGHADCPQKVTYDMTQKDARNVQPDWLRKLRTMARVTPAKTPVEDDRPIPRIILQTNPEDSVPVGLYENMQKVIELNPNYEHHHFSDASVREFIKGHFDERVVTAYDSIRTGAYRADLFRYCFLYVRGGVYIDADIVVLRSLDDIIQANDTFVSPEDSGFGSIYNALMMAAPKHPIVKRAIEMAVDLICAKDYDVGPLGVTGPLLLRSAFTAHVAPPPGVTKIIPYDYGNGVRLLKYERKVMVRGAQVDCSIGEIWNGGEVSFLNKYAEYEAEMRWYRKPNEGYYAAMYRDKTAFDPAITCVVQGYIPNSKPLPALLMYMLLALCCAAFLSLLFCRSRYLRSAFAASIPFSPVASTGPAVSPRVKQSRLGTVP
eukprot:TRINITY_DN1747_c0_g1_i2.p1 TRINITY_DN1747_c0_g1~~TRINITY_DN1747_c0_g1_i2.p1  ORF type:complete len:738 (+),score=197.60 TRINITY_DN1747_c0_g1_i2:57-2270(+)